MVVCFLFKVVRSRIVNINNYNYNSGHWPNCCTVSIGSQRSIIVQTVIPLFASFVVFFCSFIVSSSAVNVKSASSAKQCLSKQCVRAQ